MSALCTRERQPTAALGSPEYLEGIYHLTDAFRAIALDWEAVSAELWTTSAIQRQAVLARKAALKLSTLGCGLLELAVVELVLALDAITLAKTVSSQQIARVDHALATMRSLAIQRLLALDIADSGTASAETPLFLQENCLRCTKNQVCVMLRIIPAQTEPPHTF